MDYVRYINLTVVAKIEFFSVECSQITLISRFDQRRDRIKFGFRRRLPNRSSEENNSNDALRTEVFLHRYYFRRCLPKWVILTFKDLCFWNADVGGLPKVPSEESFRTKDILSTKNLQISLCTVRSCKGNDGWLPKEL